MCDFWLSGPNITRQVNKLKYPAPWTQTQTIILEEIYEKPLKVSAAGQIIELYAVKLASSFTRIKSGTSIVG